MGYANHLRDVVSLNQHCCTTVMLGADGGGVSGWKHVELLALGRHVIGLTHTEGTLGGALDPTGVPPHTAGPSEEEETGLQPCAGWREMRGKIVDEGRLLAPCHERFGAAGTPDTVTSSAALNAVEGHDPACLLQTSCA